MEHKVRKTQRTTLHTYQGWLNRGLALTLALGSAFGGGCSYIHTEKKRGSESILPQTSDEWQSSREGKIFDGDLVVGKPRNTVGSINPLLWSGIEKVFAEFPIFFKNAEAGMLSTQWFALDRFPKTRFQVTVHVLPTGRIRPQDVSIVVSRQTLSPKGWIMELPSQALARSFREAALLHARSMSAQTEEIAPKD